MTHFALDPVPDPVTASFVPLFGWLRAPSAPAEIVCSAFDAPIAHELHPRSDIANLFPGEYTTGVYAVVDLATWVDRLEREGFQLPLKVRIDERVVFDETVAVTPEALDRAAAGAGHRRDKRRFLATHLACVACGTAMTFADGMPDLLTCPGCGCRYGQRTRAVSMVPGDPSIPGLLSTSVFPYSSDEQEIVAEAAARGGMTLDFGAGLRATIDPHVINLEIADYPTTDVVATNDRLPFVDASFDAVISLHVLEHLRRPWMAAQEIQRVLKPGGAVICTVPFVCPEHGFPDHFFNMTRSGLTSLFEGMTLEQHYIKGDGAPINGLQQLLSTYYGNLDEPSRTHFGRQSVYDLVHTPLGVLLGKDFVVNLPEHARWKLAAHTTVVFRKR